MKNSGLSISTTLRAALTAVVVCMCSAAGVPRVAASESPRHAAMIIDANSGKVLHDANADEPRSPASLTKLMTLYLAFEAIDQGLLTLDSRLTVSMAAASVAPSKLELEPGETIELADAIKALVTKSANDMAVAIAEKISGNERAFAELMTTRARQIGMISTTFRNASGLPDSGQLTTARDMLTLALRIYDDFPDKARVFSLREFTYRGKTYRSHNTLMKSFPGMDGMKTGYTRVSGFNLVASVHRGGKHLVAAVFGGATASSRNAHMRQILTRALDDATIEKTRNAKPKLIASVRPAARPQRDEARPPKDVAQASQANAKKEWPAAKVAVAVPAPKPAAAKQAQPPKPAAAITIGKPADTPASSVSVTPPALAAPVEQAISVQPPSAAPLTSVTPPDAVPAQTVSVSPPLQLAGSSPAPTMPAPTKADSGPPVAPERPEIAVAASAPKLDFAALRRAITGAAAPTDMAAAAPTEMPAASPTDMAALAPAINSAPAPKKLAAERIVTPAPEATAPSRSDETIIAKVPAASSSSARAPSAVARAPSTLGAQVVMLETAPATAPDAAPGAAVATPVAFAAPVRAPSTLAAQAATIAEPSAAPAAPMHLQAPSPKPVADQPAGPAIQIGAYVSQQEAERQLAAVQARAAGTLTGTHPVARRIEAGGRQLYAARFTGLDPAASSKACLELRQKSIECFVVQSK